MKNIIKYICKVSVSGICIGEWDVTPTYQSALCFAVYAVRACFETVC